jgi:hypothetical protein
MKRPDQRMVIAARRAVAGTPGAGLLFGAGLRAGHRRAHTGK